MTKLRLLLDQMLDVEVAERLALLGHDVLRVAEVGLSREEDDQILERAIAENRILVTLDEHFGDWTVLPLFRHPGVLRIKAIPATTRRILEVPVPFLEGHSGADFEDHLIIVRSRCVRWIRTAREN